MTDKLRELARQLSLARDVKQAARIRAQCDMSEWSLVVAEAKRLYAWRASKQEK